MRSGNIVVEENAFIGAADVGGDEEDLVVAPRVTATEAGFGLRIASEPPTPRPARETRAIRWRRGPTT